METLGGFLQQARERQGLSWDQVAARTRIQPRHLQALEEEDFEKLPAKVFTKGFVRSYARALGLDENEAVQLFLVSSGSFYERAEPEQQHVHITLETAHRSRFSWNLIAVLIIFIGGALFFLLPEQQELPIIPLESETPLPLNTTPSKEFDQVFPEPPAGPSPEAPIAKIEPPHSPPPSLPADSSGFQMQSSGLPVSTPAEKSGDPEGALVLEIEATQLTWVVVQSDDQAPHEALLQPGQRVTWKAKNQYVITLGNAAGVMIRLNGESQGPFGKPGEVVRNIILKS